MSTALATPATPPLDASVIERVLLHGDLKQLSAAQKIAYYNRVCESVGLNPLTQPFQYLVLNGKEILYARRDATEQLRQLHAVSIQIMAREVVEDCYVVTARASLPSGRQDENIGAVPIATLKGEARANAMMKAETKAKRRVTLAICGLGMLDETEIESIPDAKPAYVIEAPAPQAALPPTSEREAPSEPNGGDSATLTIPDDLPVGAVLITKVEAGWKGGKAKGFFQHSGQDVGAEKIPVYDDQLFGLVSEVCQNRTPVRLQLVDSRTSGKPYLKMLTQATATPRPSAQLTGDEIF